MNAPALLSRLQSAQLTRRLGRVIALEGLAVESMGPDVFLGELCTIHSSETHEVVPAEVVRIESERIVLMPIGRARGLRAGDTVRATGRYLQAPVGDWLIGRVLDGIGRPLDGMPVPEDCEWRPLHAELISPLKRAPINEIVQTQIKVVDCFLPIGKGQRIGVFAGSGVGKSTLLSMMASNCSADVIVMALVGERGREVQDFVDQLTQHGKTRNIVVVAATSDQPALLRVHAAHTALAMCEYFCEQGKHVAFIMDSITRFAMAQREIGITAGEPPSSRGYTPSVFDSLPKIVERCGNFKDGGAITALMTVLVEGDDLNDPVADSMRSLLDGAIVLSRAAANRGHYPAVDVLSSNSRLFYKLTEPHVRDLVSNALAAIGVYESHREVIELGVYKSGANLEIERAIALHKSIDSFLKQDIRESVPREQALSQLANIVHSANHEKIRA